MNIVAVVTLLRKPRSCETTRTVRSHDPRKNSSHVRAWTSRWLVGSSSSSKSGLRNNACASTIRIRQPPEYSRVGLPCGEDGDGG